MTVDCLLVAAATGASSSSEAADTERATIEYRFFEAAAGVPGTRCASAPRDCRRAREDAGGGGERVPKAMERRKSDEEGEEASDDLRVGMTFGGVEGVVVKVEVARGMGVRCSSSSWIVCDEAEVDRVCRIDRKMVQASQQRLKGRQDMASGRD